MSQPDPGTQQPGGGADIRPPGIPGPGNPGFGQRALPRLWQHPSPARGSRARSSGALPVGIPSWGGSRCPVAAPGPGWCPLSRARWVCWSPVPSDALPAPPVAPDARVTQRSVSACPHDPSAPSPVHTVPVPQSPLSQRPVPAPHGAAALCPRYPLPTMLLPDPHGPSTGCPRFPLPTLAVLAFRAGAPSRGVRCRCRCRCCSPCADRASGGGGLGRGGRRWSSRVRAPRRSSPPEPAPAPPGPAPLPPSAAAAVSTGCPKPWPDPRGQSVPCPWHPRPPSSLPVPGRKRRCGCGMAERAGCGQGASRVRAGCGQCLEATGRMLAGCGQGGQCAGGVRGRGQRWQGAGAVNEALGRTRAARPWRGQCSEGTERMLWDAGSALRGEKMRLGCRQCSGDTEGMLLGRRRCTQGAGRRLSGCGQRGAGAPGDELTAVSPPTSGGAEIGRAHV